MPIALPHQKLINSQDSHPSMTSALLKLKAIPGSSTEALINALNEANEQHQEAQKELANIDAQLKSARAALVSRIDANPLEAMTPQAEAFKRDEKMLLDATEDHLRAIFFDGGGAKVAPDARKMSLAAMARRRPGAPAALLERALSANHGHLAEAEMMLAAWEEAGRPQDMPWSPRATGKPSTFPMGAWAKRRVSSGGAANNLCDVPPAGSVLLEMQYLEAERRRRRHAKAQEREEADATDSKIGSRQSTEVYRPGWERHHIRGSLPLTLGARSVRALSPAAHRANPRYPDTIRRI